ncbi:MAG TPA: type II toxin-antitoxin system VapC family toxin [Gemmatimonadaceae bacterium]
MIFIDSNIPMYLVGAAHPNKDASRRLLESCIERAERLVTSAEVYQEILHRYNAIRRPDAIAPAFGALSGVVDEVFPVELADVERARDLLLIQPELSSRDALHAAIMRRHGVSRILTFDSGFDRIPGAERVA